MRQPIDRKCDSFTQDMWLYLSGELGDTEHAQWDAHLETCDQCQDTLQDATDTLARFDNAPAMAPSSAGVENVLAVASRSAGRRIDFRKALGPILALAAVILLFLGNPKTLFYGPKSIASRTSSLTVQRPISALDAVFPIPAVTTDPERYRKRRMDISGPARVIRRLSRSYWVGDSLRRPMKRGNN